MKRPQDDKISKNSTVGQGAWSVVIDLASGLVHELKNPLSTIKLNLQLMSEDLSAAETQKERRVLKRIDVLEREVARLNDLLESYLQFARGGELTFEPASLNKLLDEVIDFEQAKLDERNIEVLRYYDPDLPMAELDGKRLKQALLNIIINAEHAMSGGGQLMLRTLSDEDQIVVEITDSGEGIPSEKLPRIFEAFFSSKKGGSGLGLAATKRIIEGHGGVISVQSEEGRGTLMHVSIPRNRTSEVTDE